MKRCLLILLLFILSCAPEHLQPATHYIPSVEFKTAYVDNRFTSQEKYFIQQALSGLTKATNQIIIFNIQYSDLAVYDNEFNTISLKNTSAVVSRYHHSSNKLMILKTNSTTQFVLHAQNIVNAARETKNEELVLSGFEFKWSGYDMIVVVVDRIRDDKVFENAVYHELGHALFSYDHINDKPSIMNEHPENSSGCITEADVKKFCEVYKCNWRKLNYCKL